MNSFTSGKRATLGLPLANHDPKPWQAFDILGNDYPHRVHDSEGEAASAERKRMGYRSDPRPEFDVLENPILSAARAEIEATWAGDIVEFLRWSIFPEGTPYSYLALYPDHIDHARRVLSKLAVLANEEQAVNR